jgi:predicted ABC-type ATPase
LVAGPNGSGKSSLTSGNLAFFSSYPLFDPDVLAKTIQADALAASGIAAGREVLQQVENHLNSGESFAVETTLSGKNYIQTMQRAQKLGYAVFLLYIGTSSVEISLARIERRVIGGGHNVPEADVRRRYYRSLENLVRAAHIADFAIVFDNSTRKGYQEIVRIKAGECTWLDPIPTWAEPLKASFE